MKVPVFCEVLYLAKLIFYEVLYLAEFVFYEVLYLVKFIFYEVLYLAEFYLLRSPVSHGLPFRWSDFPGRLW